MKNLRLERKMFMIKKHKDKNDVPKKLKKNLLRDEKK
jgi:hypothetical protein